MGNCFGLKRKSKTVDRNEDISSIISNGAPLTYPTASALHPDIETALRRGEELAKDLNLGNNGVCNKERSMFTATTPREHKFVAHTYARAAKHFVSNMTHCHSL